MTSGVATPQRSRAVLITGASSGIGLACATQLASLGLTVFAGVRSDDDRRRLGALAGVVPVRLDVTSAEEIRAAHAVVAGALPPAGLVGLVNNAGLMVTGPLECVDPVELRRQLDVTVVAAVAVTQAFLPLLKEAGGRIVNIGSTSGRVPSAFAGPYCAAKFGLDAITSVWREELRAVGVGVHIVDPGVVATPLWRKASAAERALGEALTEPQRRDYGPRLALRRELLERLGRQGSAAEAVSEAVAHALLAARPKDRYTVGWDAKLRVAVARAIPQRLRFWLARARR